MKCDHCNKEDRWFEIIGKDLICQKCVRNHKRMGYIHRTHMNTFSYLLRKLNPKNYEEYMKLGEEEIDAQIGEKQKALLA